jgi:uncharacterized membrane protein (DUF373 family)
MGRPEPRSVDDEGLPLPPPAQGKISRWLLQVMVYGEKVMFMAIALALLALAVVVFVRGVHDLLLAPAGEQFAVTVTRAVNGVLFIVVVLELLRTIVARLEGGGFQLQPFLVIGIISATRDILTIGAELSLVGGQVPLARTMIELGVNAGVVVALSVALVLVRRFARLERALGRDPWCYPGAATSRTLRMPAASSVAVHWSAGDLPDRPGLMSQPFAMGAAGLLVCVARPRLLN